VIQIDVVRVGDILTIRGRIASTYRSWRKRRKIRSDSMASRTRRFRYVTMIENYGSDPRYYAGTVNDVPRSENFIFSYKTYRVTRTRSDGFKIGKMISSNTGGQFASGAPAQYYDSMRDAHMASEQYINSTDDYMPSKKGRSSNIQRVRGFQYRDKSKRGGREKSDSSNGKMRRRNKDRLRIKRN